MVLDTSAVVTINMREPGYHRIAACVDGALARLIGAPSLFESAMVLSSRLEVDARPLLAEFIAARRIEVVVFSEEHYRVATEAFLRYGKGRHPAALNFGDCMSYATAMLADLPLLFIGNDFSQTDVRAAL
jgi:ribonuclease VapC